MKDSALIFLTILSRLRSSSCGHFDHMFNVRFYNYWVEPAIYPVMQLGCVRNVHTDFTFLHCENKVSVKNSRVYSKSITMVCNSTVSNPEIEFDYPYLLDLEWRGEYHLHLKDCPEPRNSYASFVFPRVKTRIPHPTKYVNDVDNNIVVLWINCKDRKNFSVTNKQLKHLSWLTNFSIRCKALNFLPADLFLGNMPNVESITIVSTRVEYIPNGLFNNLTVLESVNLGDNMIVNVDNHAFVGCGSLKFIDVDGNQLEGLDEALMEKFVNSRGLDLSRNKFRELPKNFNMLSKLTHLDLSHNLLDRISHEHCEGLTSSLLGWNVSYNKISRIDPNCFDNATYVLYIDISGNAIDSLTEKPVVLNSLKRFFFNDNSKPKVRIKQFFTSKILYLFSAKNSHLISLEDATLQGFPNILELDLSVNNISAIPKNLFRRNGNIKEVYLQRNEILLLPDEVFSQNSQIQHLNLSSNNITSLPLALFSENCKLLSLDVSFNRVENVAERFLANVTSLRVLNVSHNMVESLEKDFLLGMNDLIVLDLSDNRLAGIKSEMFLQLNTSGQLLKLELQGNRIATLPTLQLDKLEYLDVSRNHLETLGEEVFHSLPKLKHLDLSKNGLTTVPRTIVTVGQALQTLDFSHNKLIYVHKYLLKQAKNLISLDFSNNQLKSFDIDVIEHASKLKLLNLSTNSIKRFAYTNEETFLYGDFKHTNLKVLDLSNNEIDMNYSPSVFDEESATWGRVSPFAYFTHIEKLLLSNNSIDAIFLDWRINMPDLIYLDLRRNKLQYLSHQDLLFSTTAIHESPEFGPYPCSHNLTVDLRENEMRFVELPLRMLEVLPKRNETRGVYGHVTMLIEDNPFHCGCALFNLLRVVRYDMVLTSELRRNGRGNWILPAKLEIGNLSCWEPVTVRGKKLNNTEEWMHHILPLFGLCSLNELHEISESSELI